MISKDLISRLAMEKIQEKEGYFLVEVKVSATNSIKVFIDSEGAVSISDCIAVSRHIEKNLDRETQDFELEVSSPGMDLPFKVFKQYTKNIGRKVKVLEKDGKETEGVLKEVTEVFITLEIEASKKKKATEENLLVQINFNNIKETKKIITFK
ncbi:MAG: ribosome assembly cofactor RimP [Bacteroidia bacterium]|nr:ribosome assembly cofactor RimP [Bacteroidia bacterium]